MNKLLDKFKDQKRWVNYRLEKVNDKITKVPYSINGSKASSVDYSTWATYDEAKKVSDQVGIMFGKKKTLLGIDLDKIIKDRVIFHEDKEKIELFIKEANTYCELSPSKTGLHLFLEIDKAIELKANRKGNYECYASGRYFTFTGEVFGEEKEVRKVSPEEAERVLGFLGYPWKKTEEAKPIVKVESKPLEDEVILTKAFNASNGIDIKALYEGSLTKYNNDESSADMALMSHLAFWTRCNASQMERIWLSSPIGQRPKVKNRKDYRDRTIQKAIDNCTEVYTEKTVEKVKELKELDLLYTMSKGGAITYVQNTENITRVLNGHEKFKGQIKYDAFTNVVYYKDKPLEDHHVIEIQTKIQITMPDFVKVSKEMVFDAILKVARDNTYDSAIDYLQSIKWDGTKRLDQWLSKTYNTPDDIYHQKVGSNWLKGLVRRIMIPGCKFDHVLVLEGEQGTKKSTSLMVLGKDWHVETAMSTDNKDFFMMFQGKAIIEFSEGETLSRTETKRMKAIITTQVDKYRPAYGRMSVDFKRRCVFAMTTNAEEYLKDETGNRRWLPVRCNGTANIEWLRDNRDQLFAEAYHRVMVLEESTWEFPEDLMKEAQDQRRLHDPWEDIIVEWYFSLTERERFLGITIYEAYLKGVHKNSGQNVKPMVRHEEMNISDVLRRVLKLERRRSFLNGVRSYRYYPEGSPQPTEEEQKEATRDKLEDFDDVQLPADF